MVHKDVAADIAAYLLEKPVKTDVSALTWWLMNAGHFPSVGALARKYLHASTTSTQAEIMFSSCGLVVNKLRTTLTPES